MAFAQFNAAPIQTTDAEFRAWGSALSAQLAAMGLIKHTDTGQIDWATVVRAAAGASAGFEIWRFNDTLQATAPVFIKLEYGSGSVQNNPGFWITVGTATNGTGTLTGVVGTRTNFSGGANSATAIACFISGSTNRISVQMFQGVATQANNNWFFAVERATDETGAETTDTIFTTCQQGSATIPMHQVVPTTGTVAVQQNSQNVVIATANGLYGNDAGVGMMFAQKGRLVLLKNLLLGASSGTASTTRGATMTVTHFGASRTYYVTWVYWDTANNFNGLMRYE